MSGRNGGYIIYLPEDALISGGYLYCVEQDVMFNAHLDAEGDAGIASQEWATEEVRITDFVEDLCDDERLDQTLVYLGNTGEKTCADAASENDMVFDDVYPDAIWDGYCEQFDDGGDRPDDDGFSTRAAGPANYGLTTFDDVFDCSSTSNQCDVDSDFVVDLLSDFDGLFDDDQVVTIGSVTQSTGGTVTGLKMTTVGTNSLLDYLGFSQDDVVTAINGDATTTWDEAWAAVLSYKDGEHAVIEYYDGSSTQTLDLDVVNLRTYP